jgi:hypothetical protein
MDWLRWYHGASTDPKWLLVARVAQSDAGRVVAVWPALLEYASQSRPRGSVAGFDCEAIAAFYGWATDDVQRIVRAFEVRGLVRDGRIVNWSKRQPSKVDRTNAQRQARHRERKASDGARAPAPAASDNPTVTDVTTVTGGVTTQERETERSSVALSNASSAFEKQQPPSLSTGEASTEPERGGLLGRLKARFANG